MELSKLEEAMLNLITHYRPFSYDELKSVFVVGDRSFDNILKACRIATSLNVSLHGAMVAYLKKPGG